MRACQTVEGDAAQGEFFVVFMMVTDAVETRALTLGVVWKLSNYHGFDSEILQL